MDTVVAVFCRRGSGGVDEVQKYSFNLYRGNGAIVMEL
jgi:hypothetical protein